MNIAIMNTKHNYILVCNSILQNTFQHDAGKTPATSLVVVLHWNYVSFWRDKFKYFFRQHFIVENSYLLQNGFLTYGIYFNIRY